MKFLSIILLLFSFNFSFAQSINGLWTGDMIPMDPKKFILNYPIAFEIKYDPVTNTISGKNNTVSLNETHAVFSITGKYFSEGDYYYIEESVFLEPAILHPDSVIRHTFQLRFAGKNTLKGTAQCMNFVNQRQCEHEIKVRLKRVIK